MNALSARTAPRSAVAVRPRVASRRPVVVRAAVDPTYVISASTAAFLAIGRFVFLPYQRRSVQYQDVRPKTTGNGFFEDLSKPASFTASTNDPAGFNIIDVFAWGALGHAFGFAALAAASLQNNGV